MDRNKQLKDIAINSELVHEVAMNELRAEVARWASADPDAQAVKQATRARVRRLKARRFLHGVFCDDDAT